MSPNFGIENNITAYSFFYNRVQQKTKEVSARALSIADFSQIKTEADGVLESKETDANSPGQKQKKLQICRRVSVIQIPTKEEFNLLAQENEIEFWWSKEELKSFKREALAELQEFQKKHSLLSEKKSYQQFCHRINFPSSYLEESPSKLDAERIRLIENLLQNRLAQQRKSRLIDSSSIENLKNKELYEKRNSCLRKEGVFFRSIETSS